MEKTNLINNPNTKEMKKILFIIAIGAFGGFSLHAQEHLDTLFERFPNYHYNWYDSAWSHPTVHDSLQCFTGDIKANLWIMDTFYGPSAVFEGNKPRDAFAETAVAYVPDSTMHLVGVAFGAIDSTNHLYHLITNGLRTFPDRLHDIAMYHINIYDKNMNLLQSVSTPYEDGLEPARYIPAGCARSTAGQFNVYYLLLKHVFLDTPIDMSDTFYISRVITYNDSVWPYNDICSRMATHYPLTSDSEGMCSADGHVLYCLPWEYYRYRNLKLVDNMDTAQWRDDYTFGWQHAEIYPIVKNPGDSCPQVQAVQVTRSSATQVFLRWQNGENHHSWQVVYGPVGTPPDECTVVGEYTQTISGLIAVDPDSQYVAYVRARCHFARDEWGEWSDPALIWINNGIDEPQTFNVSIAPNPATGMVTVGGDTPLARVEFYDPQGRLALSLSASGTTSTVDISALPPAVYTVVVTSATGHAIRKLTVMR